MKLVLINPRNPVSLYGDYLWQPLALAYVTAATPSHWTVELIDEQVEGARDYSTVEADLVGITAFTPQAPRAYAVASQPGSNKPGSNDRRAWSRELTAGPIGLHEQIRPSRAATR